MEAKNLEEKDVAILYIGLGWMLTVFESCLYKQWDKRDEHFISKLVAHRAELKNITNCHFSIKKINELKKAIDEFIVVNKKFKSTHGFKNYFFNFCMNAKAKKLHQKVNELLSVPKENFKMVNY